VKQKIRAHGLRNSHLLSIAPTGTISLAFADNASNGIEPPFSWTYTRRKRMADGTWKEYAVEDYAWRLYKHLGGDTKRLPDYFVTALEISAQAHKDMVAAVAPSIDTSISKTVNVPEDYPYAEFEDLYLSAWKAGLKGLATYRPNSVIGFRAVGRFRRDEGEGRGEEGPAGRPPRRRQPAPVDPVAAAPVLSVARVARPPRAARRQSVVDLHDPAAAGRVRAVRRPRRRQRRAASRSRSGSTAPTSRAASAPSRRRSRWTSAPAIARGSS
jgi:hypothetical protein